MSHEGYRHVYRPSERGRTEMNRLRSVRTVQLLEVVVLEGDGTRESVAREVTSYFTSEGELVGRQDPGARHEDYCPCDENSGCERCPG